MMPAGIKLPPGVMAHIEDDGRVTYWELTSIRVDKCGTVNEYVPLPDRGRPR